MKILSTLLSFYVILYMITIIMFYIFNINLELYTFFAIYVVFLIFNIIMYVVNKK